MGITNAAVRLALLGAIEYAWNIFPSTDISSYVLLGGNVFLLLGIFFGYPDGKDTAKDTPKKVAKAKAE